MKIGIGAGDCVSNDGSVVVNGPLPVNNGGPPGLTVISGAVDVELRELMI